MSDRAPAPNIVLIIADDLGFGDLGHYNGGRTDTPVIDQMIAEGTSSHPALLRFAGVCAGPGGDAHRPLPPAHRGGGHPGDPRA